MKTYTDTNEYSTVDPLDFCSPVTVIVGHYGVGKTNFSLNVAYGLKRSGKQVTLVDLDIVNPYFRSSDYAEDLRKVGIQVITPVFAGSTLDAPSLSGAIYPAIEMASDQHYIVIDVGGDDVGATSLGRFAEAIREKDHCMLYVVNACRNLTQSAQESAELLHEIQGRSGLSATGLVNNSHLKEETNVSVIERSLDFVVEVEKITSLPLVATTIPTAVWSEIVDRQSDDVSNAPKSSMILSRLSSKKPYIVQIYVGTPWELQTR